MEYITHTQNVNAIVRKTKQNIELAQTEVLLLIEQKKCPVCTSKGKPGQNIYTREDGTFKCRTCGYDSRTAKENKG